MSNEQMRAAVITLRSAMRTLIDSYKENVACSEDAAKPITEAEQAMTLTNWIHDD